MTPYKFTKSHEREEGRRLRRGFVHSCIALALCWLPFIGLLLSADGFIRVMVRLTRRHKKRRTRALVFSFIVMCLCTGVLLGEVWVYSRDPDILSRTAGRVWTFIVGEENADVLSSSSGTDYPDMDTSGLGVVDTDGLSTGGQEDDWAEIEGKFDWGAWEESEWGDGAETDAWFTGDDIPTGDEDWADDDLWLEDEDDIWLEDEGVFLSEEELEWLESDDMTWPGDDTLSGQMHIGQGETIVPPSN